MSAERETLYNHTCSPEYVAEGEFVCFECGSQYIYAGTLCEEDVREIREDLDALAASEQTGTE